MCVHACAWGRVCAVSIDFFLIDSNHISSTDLIFSIILKQCSLLL